MTKTIAVLVPTAKAGVEEIAVSPRLQGLNDKKVGFLWNGKPNGDLLLLRIKELLSQRFSLAGTSWHQGRKMAEEDPIILENVIHTSDIVINAIAD
jgi:hypothetical protein